MSVYNVSNDTTRLLSFYLALAVQRTTSELWRLYGG